MLKFERLIFGEENCVILRPCRLSLLVTAYLSRILFMNSCVLPWYESAHVKTGYKLKIISLLQDKSYI